MLEIKVLKVKATKSLIRQFEPAKLADLRHFNSMPTDGYYVRDLGKGFEGRTAFFEGVNGWCRIGLADWQATGETKVTAKVPGKVGHRVMTFTDEHVRDQWLKEYNLMREACLKNKVFV